MAVGKSGWGQAKKEMDEAGEEGEPKYAPQVYDDEAIKAAIDKGRKKSGVSPICASLVGHDGTCKSGIALDVRPRVQKNDAWVIRDDWKDKDVLSIDLDASSAPLKDQFYPNDDHLIVLDPLVLLEKPRRKTHEVIDHVSTFNKILAIVNYVYRNQDEMKIGAIILDGLDVLLKCCEHVMRFEDLRDIGTDVKINDQWQWQNRNDKYGVVFQLAKRMEADYICTTHYKDVEKYTGGQLTKIGEKVDWEKRTPGKLYQRVNCSRSPVNDKVVFTAEIMKAKGAPHLEGSKHIVMEVERGETKWHGFHNVWEEFRTGRKVA